MLVSWASLTVAAVSCLSRATPRPPARIPLISVPVGTGIKGPLARILPGQFAAHVLWGVLGRGQSESRSQYRFREQLRNADFGVSPLEPGGQKTARVSGTFHSIHASFQRNISGSSDSAAGTVALQRQCPLDSEHARPCASRRPQPGKAIRWRIGFYFVRQPADNLFSTHGQISHSGWRWYLLDFGVVLLCLR